MASAEMATEAEVDTHETPYARRVLETIRGTSALTLLHIHGRTISFDRLATLPVHALNWHDRLTPPPLGEAKRRFPGAVAGGLNEWETLRSGPATAGAAEAREAIRETGGLGLMVTPGCVLPLDVPEAHLDAVLNAVKGSEP
jgi:uroporphyrinogen decarboxylase